MKLVIVESPSKAKTIEKYLSDMEGKFIVRSSVGHVRDLPKSNKDAVDIPGGFIPHYQISPSKKKVVSELVALAEKASEIILAPDPDREGEAIAWHLEQILVKDGKVTAPIKRVTFNEITETAIKEALQHPRDIDQNLRHAQEARRVLDRIFGYDLSGLIWKKVRYGLSAGRVQSPALRIIMEREREIRAFNPEDYFLLHGFFKKNSVQFQLDCDTEFSKSDVADEVIKKGMAGTWSISKIKETETTRKARQPFTTSTIQQVASTRLGMSPSQTMRAAQKLYEAGHITYMRTDSPNLSKEAVGKIAHVIADVFGKEYVELKVFKSKSKNAQEAHEAIRPTRISKNKSIGATEEQKRLYQLIWERTIASQMASAKLMRTKVTASVSEAVIPAQAGISEGTSEDSRLHGNDSSIATQDFSTFSVTGSRVLFPGWFAADPRSRGEDTEVPKLKQGDEIQCEKIEREDKQTQPPHRYSEAGLVKELEKRGIGRPSTYASIMRTLQDRGYVNKEGRTLIPTDTGDVVSTFVEENFTDYISDDFTADMEDRLDDIAHGDRGYTPTLREFYGPFEKAVIAKEDIPKLTTLGRADEKLKCPTCKAPMDIKLGRAGKFLSCSTYPDCEGALTINGKEIGNEEPLGQHPETGENMYVMNGRFGPYVQLGESPKIPKKTKFPKGHRKTEEEKALVKKENADVKEAKSLPKPKRASIPNHIDPEDITIEQAAHLLILPRTLGTHPDDDEPVIANIGRFGPYVGHGRNFRSIKKTYKFTPYDITLEQALDLLNQPKALPKGVELFKKLGQHPKTKKDINLLKSKSGYYVQKGMKRLYLDDKTDPEKFGLDEAVKLLSQ